MCVGVYVGLPTGMYICVQRQDINLECHSSGSIHFGFLKHGLLAGLRLDDEPRLAAQSPGNPLVSVLTPQKLQARHMSFSDFLPYF